MNNLVKCWRYARTPRNKLKQSTSCQYHRVASRGKPTAEFIQKKKSPPLLKYGSLAFPVITFGLGCWQHERLKWKENLIAELDSKEVTPPVEYQTFLEDPNKAEYDCVKLKGEFDHSKEFMLGPRSEIVNGAFLESGGGLITDPGHTGYNILTPFHVDGYKHPVIVNRGWVVAAKSDPKTRLSGQVEGQVEITGVYRKTDKKKPYVAEYDKSRKIFITRNVELISEEMETAPLFFDAVETFPGGPHGSQTIRALTNNHFNYMMTWFSLSGLTLWIWWIQFM